MQLEEAIRVMKLWGEKPCDHSDVQKQEKVGMPQPLKRLGIARRHAEACGESVELLVHCITEV